MKGCIVLNKYNLQLIVGVDLTALYKARLRLHNKCTLADGCCSSLTTFAGFLQLRNLLPLIRAHLRQAGRLRQPGHISMRVNGVWCTWHRVYTLTLQYTPHAWPSGALVWRNFRSCPVDRRSSTSHPVTCALLHICTATILLNTGCERNRWRHSEITTEGVDCSVTVGTVHGRSRSLCRCAKRYV